jgi:hypothetical protein
MDAHRANQPHRSIDPNAAERTTQTPSVYGVTCSIVYQANPVRLPQHIFEQWTTDQTLLRLRDQSRLQNDDAFCRGRHERRCGFSRSGPT